MSNYLSYEELNRLKVADLKALLKQVGLKTIGKKQELLDRLSQYYVAKHGKKCHIHPDLDVDPYEYHENISSQGLRDRREELVELFNDLGGENNKKIAKALNTYAKEVFEWQNIKEICQDPNIDQESWNIIQKYMLAK